ncbi:MAG: hypothetical protein F4Z04_06340 [Acidobacteria bacterium]|nr:hypothetical protein [Acidobacteriota bacterium]
MKPELVEADTRLEAWMKGAEHLLKHERVLNLILAINSPGRGGSDSTIDRFLSEESQSPMHTVAEFIFPAVEYRTRGLRGVFEVYPDEVYPAIEPHPGLQWGTYAHRLVRRRRADGTLINPLKQLIEKMRSEAAQRGPRSSCYELGVAEGEYDVPLYRPSEDGARRMGGPCLSHLSFKLFKGAVHLTAFYRSHDYRHKVPGNLLGLARLQACVAHEIGREAGTLVVHSSYAYLTGSKSRMWKLLGDLRRTQARKEAAHVVAH